MLVISYWTALVDGFFLPTLSFSKERVGLGKGLLAIALAVSCTWAAAESFRTRLEQAHGELRSGDVDGALAAYRDLQTDEPESKLLYYSMGCARYARAMQEAGLEAAEDALASFEEAKVSFEKAVSAANPELRRKARYNLANCTAQIAKESVAALKYDESVGAFKESVRQYEDFLRLYPDHAGARNNLDHMRYLLKKMLQNPPPPPEQQQGEGEQEDQQNQQQEQQAGESGDREQDSQEQQQQQGEQEQEQSEEQGRDQEQEAGAQALQDEAESGEEEDELEPEDRQNLEAILQSLEDMDNRELHDNIDDRRRIRMESNWW